MSKNLKNMMNGYNIALHGIRAHEGSKEIAENIMENGLNELLNIIEYAEENYGDIENDEVEF